MAFGCSFGRFERVGTPTFVSVSMLCSLSCRRACINLDSKSSVELELKIDVPWYRFCSNTVCSCFSECPGAPHELLARWVGRSSSKLEVRGCRTQFFFFFALLFIINQTILFLFFRPNLRDSLRIPKGGAGRSAPAARKKEKGASACATCFAYAQLPDSPRP